MKVLMFHSVGNDESAWIKRNLSVPLDQFKSFCEYLSKKKYRTPFLEEWYEIQNTPNLKNGKQIVLTFDDGYLDNWVYAFPILQMYGLKGTIFVNPEFIDPSPERRSNYQDVQDKRIGAEDLQTLGFLNWTEIRAMQETGVMDIQSHSMAHDWFFTSPKLLDFYSDQSDRYHWLAWLLKPQRKMFYMTQDLASEVPTGYPIFEYGRSLGIRRYFPATELIQFCKTAFSEMIERFPDYETAKEKVIEKAASFILKNKAFGRLESDEEMIKRYEYELKESKRLLEEKLAKPVEFLCWPGGSYNEISLAVSKAVGYKASTVSSREEKRAIDNKDQYKRIPRVAIGPSIRTKRPVLDSFSKNEMTENFLAINGNLAYRLKRKIIKTLGKALS